MPHTVIPGRTDARPAVMTSAELHDHERSNILPALQATSGKVISPGGAAELLDLEPTTLASRMKVLGIEAARGRAG